MKAISVLIFWICIFACVISCEKEVKDPSLDDFCNIKPSGWECEIIQQNFKMQDIPRNADTPVAIIRYKNLNQKFFWGNDSIPSSLILDFYPIEKKQQLISLIRSQQIFSWCVPVYYGETPKYFIITSPCFINGGVFTDQADSCINDLQKALKNLVTVNDYGLIGN